MSFNSEISPPEGLFHPGQSNLALYCQLHDAGHSTADLLRVQHAYRISCKLFNGRYRKTERAFICHAVGAASAMAHFDPRIELTIAAMLHAGYDSGQFPDGTFGPTESHRQWLRSQIGDEAENYVAAYERFRFDPLKLSGKAIIAEERDLLFLGLTHEVDDMAHGGLAFAPKYGRSLVARVEACVSLAQRIGQSRLAQTIQAHAQRYDDIAWIAELEVAELEGFRVAPNLYSYFRLRRDSWRGKAVEVF